MKTIALTGASGLIGSRIIELLGENFSFLPLRQEDGLDITDSAGLKSKVQSLKFDFLLHLAAYTNVDGAEKDREFCHRINVLGTRNLLDVCSAKNAKMIFISTDFVFDGTKNEPLDETTKPNPLGYYAQTKYEAEQLVKGQAMIARLTTPYRKEFNGKKDVVRTLKSVLEEGKQLHMITDNLVVPTFIDDIALALGHLIENYSPEIFHLVGSQAVSSYQMALMIADRWHLDKSLISFTTYAEYAKDKAARPQWSHIISTKDVGVRMKSFEEGLHHL